MNFSVINWVDLALAIVLAGGISFFAVKVCKRKEFLAFIVPALVLIIVTSFFGLTTLSLILLVVFIAFSVWFVTAFSNNFRKLFKKVAKRKNLNELEGAEREKLLDTMTDAVLNLSQNKIGAIITFETAEALTDLINNGEKVEAPLTSTLLRTIFYPGTPLHDGAVIIRGNMVEAAACFYTPSTKAMKGKFGARHRAALGFSEGHDAVTIVVSEETGRISFAIAGDLIPASHDTFRKLLSDYLK